MLFAPLTSLGQHGSLGQWTTSPSSSSSSSSSSSVGDEVGVGSSGHGCVYGLLTANEQHPRKALILPPTAPAADVATMAASSASLDGLRPSASLGLAPPPASAVRTGAAKGVAAWAKLALNSPASIEAAAMKAAVASAVRMEPRGLLPGNTGARVGLLHGLRTADMDQYDEVAWKKPRAPPADLSHLTAAQKLQRRNRMARYYSKLACERREALTAALEKEVHAQRLVQDIVENAPGIAFLTLSGDMRAMVLYANKASASVLRLDPETLPGRTLWDVTHPADHEALYKALAYLVLTKNEESCKRVRCRVRTADSKAWRTVHAAFRYGLLGIGCSICMM